MQTDATLLATNSQPCWMLHVASVCTPCCVLLGVVAQSLKPVKLLATCKRTQQLPTMLRPFARGFKLRANGRNNSQHCWELLFTCWKSCANGSNIVALRFGDHGTKEMWGVVGWKVWPVSNFAQQHATASNNMQQGVQTDATCNIQQCWELLVNNVASVCTGLYSDKIL